MHRRHLTLGQKLENSMLLFIVSFVMPNAILELFLNINYDDNNNSN